MSEVCDIGKLVEAVLKEFPEKFRPEVQEISYNYAKLTLGDLRIRIWCYPDTVEVSVDVGFEKGNISVWDFTTPEEIGPTTAGLAVLAGKFLKAIKGDNSGVKA